MGRGEGGKANPRLLWTAFIADKAFDQNVDEELFLNSKALVTLSQFLDIMLKRCYENLTIFSSGLYRALYRFGDAKFAYVGLVLGSSQFSPMPQLPQKSNAHVKNGQIWLENNHLALLV